MSQAITLLEKGKSIEHLGFSTDVTVEGLKEALHDTNVNNLLLSPENPLFDHIETISNDPLLSHDPSSDSYVSSDDLFDAFEQQIEGLPLDTEAVNPADVDFVSGASFFEMVFAHIDTNEVSLL
ncbi:MAG: hypothetical protein SWY16_17485 [Cyanobacteriota bacterium]|nr:hypothetical protein [Cyanobacteriota bacterium]